MKPFGGQTFSDLIRDNQASDVPTSGHPPEHSSSENALEDSRPRSSSPIDPEADKNIDHGTPAVSPVRPVSPEDTYNNGDQSIYEIDH